MPDVEAGADREAEKDAAGYLPGEERFDLAGGIDILKNLQAELAELEKKPIDRPYTGSSVSAAAQSAEEANRAGAEAEEPTLNKTDASQQLKGQQSYYYWHSDSERRRKAGEEAVPKPEPKKLGAEPAPAARRQTRSIERFSFLDDGDVVKVYIPLDGDLAGCSMDNVDVEFAEKSLQVAIASESTLHRLMVERLAHDVHAARCKARVAKSGKLILTLHKRNTIQPWAQLRKQGR